MFGKTTASLCAAIVIATVLASAASSQTAPRKQGVQPYTNFEKLWFSLPQGDEG
jgi:hypothetical protein